MRVLQYYKIHHPVGAGHAPPATIYYNEYNGLACRGGIYAARCSRPGYYDIPGKRYGTVKTVSYKPAGNLHFSQLYLTFRLFVGRGLDPSLLFCGYCKTPRRGGVTPPYGAIQNRHPVGAGHAPPATIYYNEYNGLACRGGIYAARCSRPGYYDIPGKRYGTVKTVSYKPAGNLHFSQLYLTFRLFVGRGLDPSLSNLRQTLPLPHTLCQNPDPPQYTFCPKIPPKICRKIQKTC